MPFYGLILGILGVWRVTHLLQAEDGPGDLIVRVRQAAGEGFWGSLLDCFYCLSLWVAAPFAWLLGGNSEERFLLWLALSAGAIFCERLTTHEHSVPRPFWREEEFNVLLRKEENECGPGGTARSESAPDWVSR